MATESPHAGRDLFDGLNMEYELAFRHNPFKIACVEKVISLLPPGSRVLDLGCGTGVPVSQLLADAGMAVTGIDIAPKMIAHAQARVRGAFEVADMVTYAPRGEYDAVLIVYSQLQLSYAAFHAAAWTCARALKPGGLMAVGQNIAEPAVTDESAYDETGVYVEDYPMTFWGKPVRELLLSREGQLEFLRSMGLEIVSETVDVFQPDTPLCAPETQQYVIARRKDDKPLSPPQPLPKKAIG